MPCMACVSASYRQLRPHGSFDHRTFSSQRHSLASAQTRCLCPAQPRHRQCHCYRECDHARWQVLVLRKSRPNEGWHATPIPAAKEPAPSGQPPASASLTVRRRDRDPFAATTCSHWSAQYRIDLVHSGAIQLGIRPERIII